MFVNKSLKTNPCTTNERAEQQIVREQILKNKFVFIISNLCFQITNLFRIICFNDLLCQYSNLLSKDLFFTLKTNLFLLFQICVCRLQICLQYYPTSFNVKLLLYITIVCIVQAVLIYCITTLSIRILYSTFKELNIGTYRFKYYFFK